jgi:ketosteroid isomerase-like protein
MKNHLTPFFLVLVISLSCNILFAQNKAVKAIEKNMLEQQTSWNEGNYEAYMNHYWKDDSLLFVGSRGHNFGWLNTLNNYKKTYDSKEKMGTLLFKNIQIKKINGKNYFVLGQWNLTRSSGNLSGYYTLHWKKINGKWVIVSDHSS